ncbi:MAG TPA: serine/threonine-protein kinase [Thermoanaerobaculia bacterium]|jgi:serine/threonine protein kinase|nr:serine/threonine-protein kinase [Thermoanaerobaculia bacterium]
MPNESAQRGSSAGPGPGTVLDGKYEILNRIGAGGMGEVFKARHVHLNTFRCIKVMKQALLADEVFLARFLREARIATQIHHQNIAVVHDFFIGDGGNYMVTEFIDGTTLRQWAAAHGPFPGALAADVASQILSGLDHIHRRGLLHRDISPDNVMLSYDADDRLLAKIIDLGIAKDVNTKSTEMTQAGVLIGNPKYMSPEQLGMLGDEEQIDGRADLYCLGVVIYEMLMGVAAFISETPQGYIMKHLTQTPPRFAVAKPNVPVPDSMEQVIFRALEKNRKLRYADARQFADALAPFLIAPVGTLRRDDVTRLRRGPEKTLSQMMPVLGPNDATIAESSTELKAREFEKSLIADVKARETEGDRPALQRLGEAHPPGSLVGDAAREALMRVIAEERFQRAWEDGRAEVWRAFLVEHADSPRAAEAEQMLEEAVAFESTGEGESETVVRQFLQAWPEGRHHMEAEIRLGVLRERLAARQREPQDFDDAWEKGSTAAWDRYLREHSDSERHDEARRCRQEAADYEQAIAANVPAMWRAFLRTWPEGRHRIDAELRARS